MRELKKWKYYVATCAWKETKKEGVFSGAAEGLWVLRLEKDYPLDDGLDHMGSQGYELVGIQPSQLRTGGPSPSWYYPHAFYVFKRPLDT